MLRLNGAIDNNICRPRFDQTHCIFYYQRMQNPYWFYVPLDKRDFSQEAPVQSFDTRRSEMPCGDCNELVNQKPLLPLFR